MPQSRTMYQIQPAGMILWWSNSSIPEGWLKCNGTYISKTTYSDLYAEIGVTWGDGGATFRLPDLRGRFPKAGSTYAESGNFQNFDWKGFYQMNTGQGTFSYTHGEQYMGKNTSSYQGLLFGGGWRAPAASLGTKWDTSEMRPYNYSVMVLIKY